MKDFRFPFVIDKVTGKPSVTLLFAYISFLVAVIAVGIMISKDTEIGTGAALMLFFGSIIMYRFRNLDKIKFSLKNQEIEIEDTPDTEESK